MATRINIGLARTFAPNGSKDVIIIATNKAQFGSLTGDCDAVKAAELSADNLTLIKSAVESRLSPSKESPASIEMLIQHGTDFRRFVLGVLPTTFSRGNTPSRSHSVASLVKSNKGTSDLLVVIIPSEEKYAFAQGVSACRSFNDFSMKSGTTTTDKVVDIVLALPSHELHHEVLVTRITHVVDGVRLAQRLVDEPPNVLHTDAYVEEVRQAIAGIAGVTMEVIQGHRLEEEGFGGLWGVGKASEHLPALVILTYTPTSMEGGGPSVMKAPICLVGKGIVYDTGGLSIKTPTTSMAGMKTDMGGSAAVLGAFLALARSGINSKVHGLLCISENSVGPLATRPDDVHTMLSGKTVEVNNTDAEGRLVLADGCFYAASRLKAGIIFDIATLTGAQLIAVGKNHGALFCSHEELEGVGVNVGKETGDLTFPILYAPEFHKPEFRSQVADMKNSVADRGNAQCSCAGQFIGNHLEHYLNGGGKWVHIDMAGPVWAGERATGYGVALLFGFAFAVANDLPQLEAV